MNLLEVFTLSFEALRDRKLRSALTVLMVVIGGGLMTALNGMNAGMNAYISDQLSTLAGNTLTVTPTQLYRFGRPPSASQITLNAQTVNTIKSLPGVVEVVPYYRGGATLMSGSTSQTLTLMGIDQTKIFYVSPSLSLEKGALVSPTDSIGIVLGRDAAYPAGQVEPFAKFGQTITVQYSHLETQGSVQKTVTEKKSFQVKGILNPTGNMMVDNSAYISPSVANSLLEREGKYNGIYVVTKSEDLNEQVEKRIRTIFGKDIGITSPKVMAETIQNIRSSFTSYIQSIAIVSLLVGGVGIVTTLFTSVTERTREIGVLKALGFSNSLILMLFLAEATMIGLLGGSLGLVAGMMLAKLGFGGMSMGMGSRASSPIFLPQDLTYVWILCVGLSALAGLYPAWRASRLDPVVALRKE